MLAHLNLLQITLFVSGANLQSAMSAVTICQIRKFFSPSSLFYKLIVCQTLLVVDIEKHRIVYHILH